MKHVTLLAAAALFSTAALAQQRTARFTGHTPVTRAGIRTPGTAAKTTATDTIQVLNFPSTYLDSLTLYSAGSGAGLVTGMNTFGDRGFAERFDFATGDTTVRVTGLLTVFGGSYNPASTRTVNLRVWSQGAREEVDPSASNLYYSGFPATVLATQSVSVKNLGINIGTGTDSFKYTAFSTLMAPLSDTFFAGFDATYDATTLNGDTVGLYSTENDVRFSPFAYLSGTDTIINVQNATQWDDNSWHDNAFDNFELFHHLAVFPVVVRSFANGTGGGNGGGTAGVKPVGNDNLAWYGHFPNPATDRLNISLSLSTPSDVTVTVLSLEGRVLAQATHAKLGAGDHVLPLSTSALPAGTYTYLLRTSNGKGLASQFVVTR